MIATMRFIRGYRDKGVFKHPTEMGILDEDMSETFAKVYRQLPAGTIWEYNDSEDEFYVTREVSVLNITLRLMQLMYDDLTDFVPISYGVE